MANREFCFDFVTKSQVMQHRAALMPELLYKKVEVARNVHVPSGSDAGGVISLFSGRLRELTGDREPPPQTPSMRPDMVRSKLLAMMSSVFRHGSLVPCSKKCRKAVSSPECSDRYVNDHPFSLRNAPSLFPKRTLSWLGDFLDFFLAIQR